jgi:hypothetical protein
MNSSIFFRGQTEKRTRMWLPAEAVAAIVPVQRLHARSQLADEASSGAAQIPSFSLTPGV